MHTVQHSHAPKYREPEEQKVHLYTNWMYNKKQRSLLVTCSFTDIDHVVWRYQVFFTTFVSSDFNFSRVCITVVHSILFTKQLILLHEPVLITSVHKKKTLRPDLSSQTRKNRDKTWNMWQSIWNLILALCTTSNWYTPRSYNSNPSLALLWTTTWYKLRD